jgi:carbon-monoxide dehydrogenase small subunit
MTEKKITTIVNGETYERTIPVCMTLAEFIRDELGLTGTKIGCNEGECGACTVLLAGIAVNSCLVLAVEADGQQILTIEGLSNGELHPLQQAFLDAGAVQCGFCTPGMLLTAKALLDRSPNPGEAEIRKGIEGNICRCTGYNRIIKAIMLASQKK